MSAWPEMKPLLHRTITIALRELAWGLPLAAALTLPAQAFDGAGLQRSGDLVATRPVARINADGPCVANNGLYGSASGFQSCPHIGGRIRVETGGQSSMFDFGPRRPVSNPFAAHTLVAPGDGPMPTRLRLDRGIR